MFCIHCGNLIPDGAKFCPECGNAVQSFIHEEATDGSPDTKSRLSQKAAEVPCYRLSILHPSQPFAVNPPMKICIDGTIKHSVENGEELTLSLPEGLHSLEIASSIRKKEVEIRLHEDTVLVLSRNRMTGAIQADVEAYKPADVENTQHETDTYPEYFEDEEGDEPDLEDETCYREENEEAIVAGGAIDRRVPLNPPLSGSNGRQISFFRENPGKVICIGIFAVIFATIIGWLIWVFVSFPRVSISDVLECMSLSEMTTEVSLGSTFDQDDLAITPVEVTYASNGIYYDNYGEPYVSIALDITCVSGTWQPEYQNITFWLDNSAAWSQPDYNRTEIKRGETARYTFAQPLITSSTQDVDMRLILECKTGATVNLYFTVEGIQDFFDGASSGNMASGDEAANYTSVNEGEKENSLPGDRVVTYNPATHIQRTTLDPKGYNVEIYFEIPVFEDSGAGYRKINAFFHGLQDEFLEQGDKTLASVWENLAVPNANTYSDISTAQISEWTDDIVSVSLSYFYYMGGVTDYGISTYNFNVDTGEQLRLTDLINGTETEIKEVIVQAIIQEYPALVTRPDVLDNIRNHDLETFNFYITNGHIHVCFSKYEIADGAAGVFDVELKSMDGDVSSENDALVYFVEYCDTEYFSKADLTGFDADMCRIARNGIYARSGRIFQDEALQEYFAQYSWYIPTIAADAFTEDMLNDYQIANRDLIIQYETEQGYR